MAPVTVTLSGVTTVGLWAAILGVVGIFLRQIVPWRKQTSDAEARLRDALIARVEKLESKLERLTARHAAERALGNHMLQNITACFDATLLMLEMNPQRAPEIVTKIKEMRAAQMVAEAQEKAIIRAAEIEADNREVSEEAE